MDNYHVLVTDNLHEAGIKLLHEAGNGVTFTAPGKMDRASALAHIPQAHALIVRSGTQADREMIEAAAKLKVICRAGVGVDNIDIQAATERGIVVMNAPDGNTIATAELTIGLMLALARHIVPAAKALSAGNWDRKKYQGTELRGKNLGIIGIGRVGTAVAQRAAAFEMCVFCSDPEFEINQIVGGCAECTTLDDMLATADYIALHAPLNDQTRHIINAETIAKMKDGVRIINTARGALIDDQALADALASGKVAGAAVDVYHTEPPASDHPLIGLPNVVHTPHLGAGTAEAQAQVAEQAVRQALSGLLKGEFNNVINPAALPD